MTAEDFAKSVRSGDLNVPATKVILTAEGQRIAGRGLLRVSHNSINLEFEPTTLRAIPECKPGFRKPDQFWKVSGLIDGDLKFWSVTVDSAGRRSQWGFGKQREFVNLDIDSLELKPTGVEALTPRQRQKIWGGPPVKPTKYASVRFSAILVGCKQVFSNAETITLIRNDFLGGRYPAREADTFIDRSKDYDFALIRREDDLHVHFRSKAAFRSRNEADDWRRFQTLLQAVGFTHGVNPWPYSIEYWRGGRKITHRFTAPRPLKRTRHAPFDLELGRKAQVGRKGERNSAIRLAAVFFEKQTPLAKKLARLLFLFREAGNESVHLHLRTLAVCSIFESVVSVLFEELNFETNLHSVNPQFHQYVQIRDRLVGHLRRISARAKARSVARSEEGGQQNVAYDRLAGVLTNAAAIRIKDRYRALCDSFALNYDDDMKRRMQAWDEDRNALAHGTFTDKDTDFQNHSLIAGAINILALKAMGYSGLVVGSAFEPLEKRYQKI